MTVQFGAWVRPDQYTDGTKYKEQVVALEAKVGGQFDILHDFVGRVERPSWKLEWAWHRGQLPMASWTPGRSLDVANGRHDAFIRSFAQAIGTRPMILRLWHEPDVYTVQPDAGTPTDFVAGWKRVRSIFREHAPQVQFMWCPTAYSFTTGKALPFWPGMLEVDLPSADGYCWFPRPGFPWRPFSDVFKSFYAWGSSLGLPLMIGEFGAQEHADPTKPSKAAWVGAIHDALQAMPAITGLVAFSSRRTEGTDIVDWRLDSTPASATAYATLRAKLRAVPVPVITPEQLEAEKQIAFENGKKQARTEASSKLKLLAEDILNEG